VVENGDNTRRIGRREWKITDEKPKECRFLDFLDPIWRRAHNVRSS